MFHATSSPFIGSVDPPLPPFVMAEQATQSKNSPAATSGNGETVVQNTVFHNSFTRRVAGLPNWGDAASGRLDQSVLSLEEPLIADTGLFLIRTQEAVESRCLSSDARPQSRLDNVFIDLSSITQTKPSSAWTAAPSVQSLLFSGVVLSGMVFQISTTYPAAVDVAPTFERAPRPFF